MTERERNFRKLLGHIEEVFGARGEHRHSECPDPSNCPFCEGSDWARVPAPPV